VASDLLGKSGRAMLRALCQGEQDAGKLAELALGRLREKIPSPLLFLLPAPHRKRRYKSGDESKEQ
jgi:hypothetical protein